MGMHAKVRIAESWAGDLGVGLCIHAPPSPYELALNLQINKELCLQQGASQVFRERFSACQPRMDLTVHVDLDLDLYKSGLHLKLQGTA